jgi:hypothetical protein
MLSLFTVPRAFEGHISVIQRNATKSWTLLDPKPEVILLGNEAGTAEVCREFDLRHDRGIQCNEFGTPLLSSAYRRVQEIARNEWVCYCNCDIILTQSFMDAFLRLLKWRAQFLMVGQRTDLNIADALDFTKLDWEAALRQVASRTGAQRSPDWIDYFLFSRSLCGFMLPFAVGCRLDDQWWLWKMQAAKVPVVDVSRVVLVVHQNHDYPRHPEGSTGLWKGVEFERNRALAGSLRHQHTIADAPYVLRPQGIRRSYRHWGMQLKRDSTYLWHLLLGVTRTARHRLGLRKQNLGRGFHAK